MNLIITLKEGQLIGSPTGQRQTVLLAEKEDNFFVKDHDIRLRFTRNEKQEIDGFILFQGGMEVKCPKIK